METLMWQKIWNILKVQTLILDTAKLYYETLTFFCLSFSLLWEKIFNHFTLKWFWTIIHKCQWILSAKVWTLKRNLRGSSHSELAVWWTLNGTMCQVGGIILTLQIGPHAHTRAAQSLCFMKTVCFFSEHWYHTQASVQLQNCFSFSAFPTFLTLDFYNHDNL